MLLTKENPKIYVLTFVFVFFTRRQILALLPAAHLGSGPARLHAIRWPLSVRGPFLSFGSEICFGLQSRQSAVLSKSDFGESSTVQISSDREAGRPSALRRVGRRRRWGLFFQKLIKENKVF